MKRKTYFSNFLLFFGLLFLAHNAIGQTTLNGNITDETGTALIGANVIIKGTSTGTVTDIDGNFTFITTESLPLILEVSYTGYSTREVDVASAGSVINIQLVEGILTEEVVVSASRRREKVQEAPASVSVIGTKQLENSAQSTDAVRNLINVPGVQISQQSASRINIEMRSGNSIFSSNVFPIMDYRSLVGPGIGTFQSDASGISTVDLARIEVVRGAGSALYGPGVASGVVHFITKNPIDYPGTTVEVMGGELNTIGVTARHASRSKSRKFGYKINAQYKRGDEFSLDLVEDAAQIAKLKKTVSQPGVTGGIVDAKKPGEVLLTEADLDPDGNGNPMQEDWMNMAINATLEFRPADDLSVFVSGGMNQASAVFYNSQGEGLTQISEVWTQARMQKGGLFAQVFYVNNNGGTKEKPTFLYQTGLRTPLARQQIEGQIQYNFDVPSLLNANITVGTDYRLATVDTENLVYGRNEEDDNYNIYGAYAQGKFALGDKVDLVLAGRYDKFNFVDKGAFSPRAALVFKINPKHTFRASFNNASIPPSGLVINIDFPVAAPVPGLFDVWLRGQKTPHTWTDPTIDITVPGFPDLPTATPGLPLAIPYSLVAGDVVAQVLTGFAADPALAPLIPAIQAYFADPANAPSGFTGTFSPFNLFDGQPMPELVPTATARIGSLNSFEVGYKGLIGDKLGISIDVYTMEQKGFAKFTAVGPTVALVNPDIAGDLGASVQSGLTDYLMNTIGLPEANAVAIATAIGNGFSAGGAAVDAQLSPLYGIFGVIESDQVPKDDGIAHVTAGYRSFADAKRSYWGSDISLKYYFSSELSAFGNYSFLSQTDWIPGADDDDGLPFRSFLTSPKNKFRMGINYTPTSGKGIRANASFQHDDEFYADLGQFSGIAKAKNLVDAGVGYLFGNGLSIDISANNLFNSEYRAYPNFPKIGRIVLAKVRYTFGADGE